MARSEEDPERYSMSFGDHLEELRRRILLALAAPLPLWIVIFVFSEPLVEVLCRPLVRVLDDFDLPRHLQVLAPTEALMIRIKLSLILALVISGPWILWQAWLFVRPGLYRHERRFVHILLPGSALLSIAGVALLYLVMLPLMLRVLVAFGTSMEVGPPPPPPDPRVAAIMQDPPPVELRLRQPASPAPGTAWLLWPENALYVAVEVPGGGGGTAEILRVRPPQSPMLAQEFRLTWYANFVLVLLLGIVIAFQMPLVILVAGWVGLVDAAALRAKRRHALFVCGVVSAVITPADAFSMIMMLVPLYGLYELGILLLVTVPAEAIVRRTSADARPPVS